MLRRILLYFMLFCCLMTKDGFSYVFDFLKETTEMAILGDFACEDSMEEEGAPEDWWNHDALPNAGQQAQISNPKRTYFPERNESILNVLLEQVSPPPRMA